MCEERIRTRCRQCELVQWADHANCPRCGQVLPTPIVNVVERVVERVVVERDSESIQNLQEASKLISAAAARLEESHANRTLPVDINSLSTVDELARNKRLGKIIGAQMHQARALHQTTGKAARIFAGFQYRTVNSWSCCRRVVAKAEYLDKGENPRFVVTSLSPDQWPGQDLHEKFYCARGEMENRIKEQMCLFADRLSTDAIKGNQLRLYFSALAYTLIEALRRLALKGAEWAQAQVDTIRLKLFKIGAVVKIGVRRILLELSSTYPWRSIFAHAFHAVRC